ncbi:MAG: hypothetical protein LBT66_09315 [Methanobrevibacter sp.]|jgi:hypothetical protein|nr:hypothetical protein [Candidatus Methanovirga meridionalis]
MKKILSLIVLSCILLGSINYISAFSVYDNYVLVFNNNGNQSNIPYIAAHDNGLQAQSWEFFNGNYHNYDGCQFYYYKLNNKIYITSWRYFHSINEPLPENFITGATPLFDGNNWSITNHELINRTLINVQLNPDGSINSEAWMSYYSCDVTLINTIPFKQYENETYPYN